VVVKQNLGLLAGHFLELSQGVSQIYDEATLQTNSIRQPFGSD
jgi:hypothetical protein